MGAFSLFTSTTSTAVELFTFVFTLTIVFIGIVIFFENKDPAKTLAWLLILVVFPVLGFFLYIFFGRKFTKLKRFRRKGVENLAELAKIIQYETESISRGQSFIEKNVPRKIKLVNLIVNTASSPFTLNNKIQVLNNGHQTFNSFFEAIEQAKHHVHLEFYIFRNDTIGKKMQELLIKKARSGVEIRLIFDGYGSRHLKEDFINQMKINGIKVRCFSPVILPLINNRINYRNHRKILIVDGSIGFVGGLNIGDEYLGKSKQFSSWRDTHLKIQGDAVKFLQYIFSQDWYFNSGEKLYGKEYYPSFKDTLGEELIQIAASGPDSPWEPIMQIYFSMITNAEKTIYITTPYFIPNESILMAIKNAALGGLDVRIIIPGKPDNKFVYYATMSYLKDLLETGVRVYLYQKGFIHSKTITIDGIVSSVGSANMDQRSFNLNFEVNAFIFNKNISQMMVKDFFEDLKNSRELSYIEYIRRPFHVKFLESAAKLFSPLL